MSPVRARATKYLRYGIDAFEARRLGLVVPESVPDRAVLHDPAKAPMSAPEGDVLISMPWPICGCWVWTARNHRTEAR